MPVVSGRKNGGFSVVELMVVIGVITILIALLLPAMSRVRARGMMVQCQSNLRQLGQAMLMYANENKGQLYPADVMGTAHGFPSIEREWFIFVLHPKPPVNSASPRDWVPGIMLCPADGPDPHNYHSYVLNGHLEERGIQFSTKNIRGRTADQVVVMGEKVSSEGDYYLQTQPDTGTGILQGSGTIPARVAAWVELFVYGYARGSESAGGCCGRG